MLRPTGIAFILFLISCATALAQQSGPPSTCLAIAKQLAPLGEARVVFASTGSSALRSEEVAISYQGHSTYLIESASGVTIATDYAGFLTTDLVPRVVTMNRAHSSHYTDFPNPQIRHVFRGWGTDGKPAGHHKMVDDVLIRNVTTDLLRFSYVPNGNSIFIFEVAGLCIGHLGHLHHALSDDHIAEIGRLDVVMVPVDGGLTLSHAGVRDLLDRLRSSVILPMHVRFAGALPRFLAHLGDGFLVEDVKQSRLILSLRTLPRQPTVKLLPGVKFIPYYDE